MALPLQLQLPFQSPLQLLFLILFVTSISPIAFSKSTLSLHYYAKTCPHFQDIVTTIVHDKQTQSPTTAAATLRVFFHDCVVDGCDASVLVTSSNNNTAERDAEINHSLAGDAFDVVSRIKTAVELSCPGVVSCADILAMATRNLITMTGGPHYKVPLGRKDGLVSQASRVEGNLARSNQSLDQIISIFKAKNLSVQEMVVLTGGGHTIGFSHCNEFSNRLFGKKVDPSMNPKLAAALKILCANYTENPAMSAFLDVMSPGVFDNKYFQNLKKGLGILASDNALVTDPRTKPFIEKYAKDSKAFFDEFGKAMEKLGGFGVKTGDKGEVRRRCDMFN